MDESRYAVLASFRESYASRSKKAVASARDVSNDKSMMLLAAQKAMEVLHAAASFYLIRCDIGKGSTGVSFRGLHNTTRLHVCISTLISALIYRPAP